MRKKGIKIEPPANPSAIRNGENIKYADGFTADPNTRIPRKIKSLVKKNPPKVSNKLLCSPAVINSIFDRIANGELLQNICKEPGLPKESTIRTKISRDKELTQKYIQAKQLQMDFYAEEMINIADDSEGDYRIVYGRNGKPRKEFDIDNVKRSELRVKTRQWLMGKLYPKLYGDRKEISGPDGGPLQMQMECVVVQLPHNGRDIKEVDMEIIEAELNETD